MSPKKILGNIIKNKIIIQRKIADTEHSNTNQSVEKVLDLNTPTADTQPAPILHNVSMSSSYHGNTSTSMSNDTSTLAQKSSSLIENVNAEHSNIIVQSSAPKENVCVAKQSLDFEKKPTESGKSKRSHEPNLIRIKLPMSKKSKDAARKKKKHEKKEKMMSRMDLIFTQEKDDQDNEMVQDAEPGEQMLLPHSSAAGIETETTAASEATSLAIGEIKEVDSGDAMDEKLCIECGQMIKCKYSLLKEIMPPPPASSEDDAEAAAAAAETPQTEIQYLCDTACVTKFNNVNTQYKLVVPKKVPIYYAMDTEQSCQSCSETKQCKYRFKEPTDAEQYSYVCEEECLNRFTDAHPNRYLLAKKRFIIEEIAVDQLDQKNKCLQCLDNAKCKYTFKEDDDDDQSSYYLCMVSCLNLLMAEQPDRFRFKGQLTAASATVQEKSKKMVARTEDQKNMAEIEREVCLSRRCAQCQSQIMLLVSRLSWEAMDFCNKSCLEQYQQTVCAACESCHNAVSVASMGKYCVRFRFELRQFCGSACVDAFKKRLKVCSYCQTDIFNKNDEFFSAPINGQSKDFCSKTCTEHYKQIFNIKKHTTVKQCAMCNNQKNGRVEIIINGVTHYICSDPCFLTFTLVNRVILDPCSMCRKYFEIRSNNSHTIHQDNETKVFCSKICMDIFIHATRKLVPCQSCKAKKYNFDMIEKVSSDGATTMLCSINCLSMYEVSMEQQNCHHINSMIRPQWHLTDVCDGSMRNFCTHQCAMSFESQFSRAPLTLDEEVSAAGGGNGALADCRSNPVPTGRPNHRIKSTKLLQQQQRLPAKSQAKTKSQTHATTTTYRTLKQSLPSGSNNMASSTQSTRRINHQVGSNSMNYDLSRLQPVVVLERLPDNVVIEKTLPATLETSSKSRSIMEEEENQRPQRKRGPIPRGQQPKAAKRQRRDGVMQAPPQPEPQREPVEKADTNMCLKFTFGVNAWKQWVMTKNAELEKSSVRKKLFKTELLQLTADELNDSLCLFIKEVRKPNGSEYAPDTIYYLVLGIQEYLYENGRIDNIFTDPNYERFTDCLDEVSKKFSVLYNDSQSIVTRVEEEHLWECKQLGAHSPHVLLNTLMFFNSKHFNLTTVEEHMQLSFSHIMKHWKRSPNQGSGEVAGSRNVLLRFYPPQSSHIDNSRKKKVYEQQENEENPLRCPVKLYEFYLSKCPESVKTRNDVFYLLPERSCVPDSPVWYSTQALGKEALSKMLHRVKMVKEINIALLTS